MSDETTATATVTTDSTTATIDNSGRTMGMLSIAAAPGALLISPSLFALAGFFLALIGLTVSSPSQRYFSFIGMAGAAVCGVIGVYFNTPII